MNTPTRPDSHELNETRCPSLRPVLDRGWLPAFRRVIGAAPPALRPRVAAPTSARAGRELRAGRRRRLAARQPVPDGLGQALTEAGPVADGHAAHDRERVDAHH